MRCSLPTKAAIGRNRFALLLGWRSGWAYFSRYIHGCNGIVASSRRIRLGLPWRLRRIHAKAKKQAGGVCAMSETTQRVVITGAAGALGSAVPRAFLTAGAKVALIDRAAAGHDPLKGTVDAHMFIEGVDLTDPA